MILLAVIVSREPKRLDGPRRQSSPVASSVPPTAPPLPDAIVPSPDARPTVRLKADPTYSNLKADPTYSNRVDVHTPPDAESLAPPSIDLESIAVAASAEDQSIRVEPLPPLAPIAVTPLGVENEGDRR